jgi:hypothetical protein
MVALEFTKGSLMMEPPKDVAEARRFLERAEGETNPQRKIEELKQGEPPRVSWRLFGLSHAAILA